MTSKVRRRANRVLRANRKLPGRKKPLSDEEIKKVLKNQDEKP